MAKKTVETGETVPVLGRHKVAGTDNKVTSVKSNKDPPTRN